MRGGVAVQLLLLVLSLLCGECVCYGDGDDDDNQQRGVRECGALHSPNAAASGAVAAPADGTVGRHCLLQATVARSDRVHLGTVHRDSSDERLRHPHWVLALLASAFLVLAAFNVLNSLSGRCGAASEADSSSSANVKATPTRPRLASWDVMRFVLELFVIITHCNLRFFGFGEQ